MALTAINIYIAPKSDQEQNILTAVKIGADSEAAAIPANGGIHIRWGEDDGVDEITRILEAAHLKIATWQKNTLELPRNATGKAVITEATRLVKLFNSKTPWEPVAVHLFVIFLPLMLQKPAAR